MAVVRMVRPASLRSIPLMLAAGTLVVAVAAGVIGVATVLLPGVPTAHPITRTSTARAAAGPSRPGTAGSVTDAPAPLAADAAPAAHAARGVVQRR